MKRSFAVLLALCVVTLSLAPVTVSAAETATLSGTVTAPDGKPVAGAKVAAAALEAGAGPAGPRGRDAGPKATGIVEGTTGADGTFRLEVQGKSFGLRVQAPGYAVHEVRDVQPGTPLAVALVPGVGLDGQVFDLASGKPLPGAEVRANPATGWHLYDPDDAERFAIKVKADANGRFRFKDLVPDAHGIVARADGHRAVRSSVRAGEGKPVTLYLGAGATLPGRIVDRAGKPIAGATVSPFAAELFDLGEAMQGQVKSGAQGEFELAGLPAGTYTIVARHKDYADAWLRDVKPGASGRARPVTITLDKGSDVRATLAAGDAPFAGKASLHVVYAGPGMEYARSVDRGLDAGLKIENGVLTASNLPAGKADVTVIPESYKRAERLGVTIAAGEVLDLGTIALERGPSLAGKVTDPEGKPLGGVNVQARSLSQAGFSFGTATSNDDGTFTVANLAAERTYTVSAQKTGFGSARLENVKLADTPDLVLRPQGKLTGKVVSGDPPAPVTLFAVELSPTGETNDMMGMGRALGIDARNVPLRDAAGTIKVDDVEAGTYSVKVKAAGFVPARIDKLEVKPGQTAELGEVRLERGKTLRLVVVDRKTKTPVGGAEVSIVEAGLGGMVREAAGSRAPEATTGPDGRVTLEGLEPGRLTLRTQRENYAPLKSEIDIDANVVPPDQTLELTPGGTVEGVVRDKTGQIRAGYMVMAMSGISINRRTMATTDETGAFRMEHVAPGDYMIMAMPTPSERQAAAGSMQAEMMSQMQMQTIKVEDERTARADFPVGGVTTTIRVHGRVLKGKSASAARVSFVKGSGGAASDFVITQSGADGSYEVKLSSAGHYQVRAQPSTGDNTEMGFGVPVEVPEKPDFEFDIVQPAGVVSGTVNDGDTGQPLKGVYVMAVRLGEDGEMDPVDPIGGNATTGEDGTYRIEGLRASTYRLSYMLNDYAIEVVGPVKMGDEKELAKGASLLHAKPVPFVVRGENDKPVQGAMILPLDTFLASVGRMQNITDAEGRYTLKELGPGAHDVATIAAGYAPNLAHGVSPDAGEPVQVQLQRGGSVKLRIVDASGQGVAGAGLRIREGGKEITQLVMMNRIFSGGGFTFVSDKTGGLTVEALEPGEYEFGVVRGSDVVQRKTVKIAAGKTGEVEIKLP